MISIITFITFCCIQLRYWYPFIYMYTIHVFVLLEILLHLYVVDICYVQANYLSTFTYCPLHEKYSPYLFSYNTVNSIILVRRGQPWEFNKIGTCGGTCVYCATFIGIIWCTLEPLPCTLKRTCTLSKNRIPFRVFMTANAYRNQTCKCVRLTWHAKPFEYETDSKEHFKSQN